MAAREDVLEEADPIYYHHNNVTAAVSLTDNDYAAPAGLYAYRCWLNHYGHLQQLHDTPASSPCWIETATFALGLSIVKANSSDDQFSNNSSPSFLTNSA